MGPEYKPCPSPDGDPECQYRNTDKGCREDLHHLYYPSYEYQTAVEKMFRNLPDNKELICRRLHDITHRFSQPLPKPPQEEMRTAIVNAEMAGAICLSATKRRMVYGS